MQQPNAKGIKQHIEFLFQDINEGFIEISTLRESRNFTVSQIRDAIDHAIKENESGKNVYTVGSVMDLDTPATGRNKDADFLQTNTLWCDIDEAFDPSELRQKYARCPPSLVVVTGRQPHLRTHLWWKLDKPITDPLILRNALIRIQTNLGGDPAAKNPSRLMRIGGSIAYPVKKGRTQELTEVVIPQGAGVTTLEAVLESYPQLETDTTKTYAPTDNQSIIPEQRKSKPILHLTEEWSESDIVNILTYIPADCEYSEWIHIGMAIKDYGLPFSVWDSWSSRGGKYQQHEMIAKWNSFSGNGIGIGTLIHTAKQNGWKPQEKKRIERTNVLNNINKPVKPPERPTDETHPPLTVEPSKPSGLYYIKAADIRPSIDANDFVQNTLTEGALSVVYGESNCGKTFFMTDLAFHVALGREWRSKRVEQGGVIYVALEGAYGLNNRVAAFKQHYHTVPDMFAVVPCQVDFMSQEGNINEFISLLHTAIADLGIVKLVVIDTLARAIAGGDENSGEDMGMLVYHADRIRLETGAHVCFIHHSGKDKARGARGHSSLRAAVDTEIEISRDQGANHSTVRIVKQREMNMGQDTYFSLETVSLGANKYGEDVTSCIVMPIDQPDKKTKADRAMTPVQSFVYEALLEALHVMGADRHLCPIRGMVRSISYDELREELENRGFKEMLGADGIKSNVKGATQNARIALKKHGKIDFNGSFLWLQNQGEM